MSEMKILIEGSKVTYTGLFRVDELYKIFKSRVFSKGYYIEEKNNREDILETGKQIVVDMVAFKKFNDYERSQIKVKLDVRGLKEKVITIDGHKQKYQQGDVTLIFFAFHETDYRNKWEDSGFQFLVRTLMDKFVRHTRTHEVEDQIKKDTLDVMNEVRSYLNMVRFKVSHDLHPHKA